MKKEDKAIKKEDEAINVWEKVIELTEDGEVVGYYFQYKRRMRPESEVKEDEEPRGTDDQE